MRAHSEVVDLAGLLRHGKLMLDAQRLEDSFYEFVKAAWSQFDPADFVGNWHLEDLCMHLEYVARGYIPRGVFNVPPRTAKSNVISVCFPAWVWAQRHKLPLMGPHVSFFYASYAEQLSVEHSIKCRRLIESRWYQERWAGRFRLIRDTKGYIENDKGGYRMATSVDAKATGWGADIIVADDPHLVKEAESDQVREDTVRWWSETIPSRLNNRKTGAMIIVMQRVHAGDVSGHVLDPHHQLGYVHFCAPMRYEPVWHVNAWVDRRGDPCSPDRADRIATFTGEEAVDAIPDEAVFWIDIREEDGELLWDERFPEEEVVKLERELGPYAFAGQYQQNPAPRGGGIIKLDWWLPFNDKYAEELGVPVFEKGHPRAGMPKEYPPLEYVLAALDTAHTEKEENDPSALSIWGVFRDKGGNPKIILMFCWTERYEIHKLVQRVGADCRENKVDRLIIEDKAAGHSVAQELGRLFGTFDFAIQLVDPRTGFIKTPDKAARLHTVVHLFAEGHIFCPDADWAQEMKMQCATVPRAIHDDLADTCSMALIYLRRAGWAVRKEEREIALREETRFKRRSTALYPV